MSGEVLYLGRAVDLRRRVQSYWVDLGDRPHLAEMVRQVRRVEAVSCDSAHEAAWLERNMLERRLPPWNRTAGGQETPVHIRLEEDARGSRLRVVPGVVDLSGARCFGPYLGGSRTRAVARALLRTYPLAARHTDGGSARELARIRRQRLAPDMDSSAAITAVLRGESTAVQHFRAALEWQREQAASVLAFELAQQIQTELEALDWVAADQKASSLDRRDFHVAGWAEGMLVYFDVLDGRLCDWRWSASAFDDASGLVAATADLWRPFAHRNALLAAKLARADS